MVLPRYGTTPGVESAVVAPNGPWGTKPQVHSRSIGVHSTVVPRVGSLMRPSGPTGSRWYTVSCVFRRPGSFGGKESLFCVVVRASLF